MKDRYNAAIKEVSGESMSGEQERMASLRRLTSDVN